MAAMAQIFLQSSKLIAHTMTSTLSEACSGSRNEIFLMELKKAENINIGITRTGALTDRR
jgi:hypothetical protein